MRSWESTFRLSSCFLCYLFPFKMSHLFEIWLFELNLFFHPLTIFLSWWLFSNYGRIEMWKNSSSNVRIGLTLCANCSNNFEQFLNNRHYYNRQCLFLIISISVCFVLLAFIKAKQINKPHLQMSVAPQKSNQSTTFFFSFLLMFLWHLIYSTVSALTHFLMNCVL